MFGRTVDLGGVWDFRYDAESRGEAGAWYSSDAGPAWTKIQVPGSFDQALRNDVLYQGKAWYRTWFDAAPAAGERALLHFDGVAIRSKVWVNGTLAGEHLFPYTGFTLDVTSLVHAGSNRLVVLADNQLLAGRDPGHAMHGVVELRRDQSQGVAGDGAGGVRDGPRRHDEEECRGRVGSRRSAPPCAMRRQRAAARCRQC